MKTDTVTVGGLPGTGTSTLCRLLKDHLGLPYVYAGEIFRNEAKARDMSLAEFGALCQADPSVDEALDEKQVELLRGGGILLEGRLSGQLAARNDLDAFKVWVICDDDERVRRIVERDGGEASTELTKMVEREASEADRYQRYYGIDLGDFTVYDLVLDSTRQSPAELADAIAEHLQS